MSKDKTVERAKPLQFRWFVCFLAVLVVAVIGLWRIHESRSTGGSTPKSKGVLATAARPGASAAQDSRLTSAAIASSTAGGPASPVSVLRLVPPASRRLNVPERE